MKTTIEISNVKHFISSTSYLKIDRLVIDTMQNILIKTKVNSGLSAFLKLLSGVVSPDEGEILIFGENLNYCSEAKYIEIKKTISYSYQHGVMVSNLTILENLLLTLNFHFKELTYSERVNYIYDFIKSYDINHHLDKRPVDLGFMQKKIFGIIRSCLINPRLLILDEPFQNLETKYCGILESLIERHIAKGNHIILGASLNQEFEFVNQTINYFPFVQQI